MPDAFSIDAMATDSLATGSVAAGPVAPWLWLAAVGVPLTMILIVLSALVERSSPIRLRSWAEGAGPRLADLYQRPRRFEAFRFLLTIAALLAPMGLFVVLDRLMSSAAAPAAPWVAAALVVILVALMEWLSRYLVAVHAETTLQRMTWPLRMLATLTMPLVMVFATAAADASENDPESDEASEEDDEVSANELEAYIDVGRREGILEPEEEELVKSIVDFGDTLVRQVMTPRVDIFADSVDTPLKELATRFFECKHARLPLFRESIDHIVGILHIRDLFEAMSADDSPAAADLAKPPLFVPESKPIRALLTELQSLHQQMAIVVDEYGGVAGLVTVEDLVEEIVGEIADEHEVDEATTEALEEGGWRVAGRTEMLELTELVGDDLGNGNYETVSGLVCGRLGYVPAVGERLELEGLSFRVEAADERRVTSVVIQRVEDLQEGAP